MYSQDDVEGSIRYDPAEDGASKINALVWQGGVDGCAGTVIERLCLRAASLIELEVDTRF